MKMDSIILHPLPRVDEIKKDFDRRYNEIIKQYEKSKQTGKS